MILPCPLDSHIIPEIMEKDRENKCAIPIYNNARTIDFVTDFNFQGRIITIPISEYGY